MKLTDRFDDSIFIDGKEYEIDMTFDNILKFYELSEDKEIDPYKKIAYMLEMLVFDIDEIALDIHQKKEIIEHVSNKFIAKDDLYNKFVDEEENEDMKENEEKPKKIYDFVKDASLIYASFMKDYKIDLIEQQGKLHWRKFMSLLEGLSNDTPLMKVIEIRTTDIPKPDKYNAKERQKMIKLKNYYSLEKLDLQKGLDKAASYLRSYAKEKEGDDKK